MRGQRKIAIGGLVLVVLAVVFAALFGGNGASEDNNGSNDLNKLLQQGNQPSQQPTEPGHQLKKRFTLTGHGQVPTASQYVRKGVLNSQGIAKPHLGYGNSVAQGQRYASDSPTSRPHGATTAAKLRDVDAKIYQDPIVGYMYGNMLCRMHFGTWSVGAHNPWLRREGACRSNSRVLVHKALPYWWATSTPRHDRLATKAWARYEAYASRVVTLVNNLHLVGVRQHPRSSQNWHLFGSGMVAGRFPVAGLNKRQENLPALVLAVTNKGQRCEQARVGINLKDSRPEVFAPMGCTVTVPHQTVTHRTTTSSHGCLSNCGNTTTHHHGKGGPPPSHHKCNCVTPSQVEHTVPQPAAGNPNAPSHAPSANPTQSVDPSNPSQGQTGGDNGGSTSNPVPSGTPTPGDTATHSTPVPTPTSGPLG